MLETRATIIRVHEGRATVHANQVNGCEQCNGQGCGSSKVAQLFCSKPRYFEVDNPIAALPGEEVIVSVADGAVLRGISLAYLLPVACLVTMAGLASALTAGLAHGDLYVAGGAVLGLVCGIRIAKLLDRRHSLARNHPYVARKWMDAAK